VNPGVTPELQEIIYRALERDPKKKISEVAHEFALDLETSEKGGPLRSATSCGIGRQETLAGIEESPVLHHAGADSRPCLRTYALRCAAKIDFAKILTRNNQ